MEEIDIIELLKRVKEGKAPKRIEVYRKEYETRNTADIVFYYTRTSATGHTYNWLEENSINTITKIKILDKPIIEELKISTDGKSPILIKKDGKTNTLRTIDVEIINKLNEIIKVINKENKDG